MAPERALVGFGALAWLALAALAAMPYALFYTGAVGAYYGVGLAGPLWIGLLAAVSVFALLAGVKDRTDPATAAGIAVTFGGFALALALGWALPALPVAAGFDVDPIFGYHPHAVVVVTAAVEVAAAGYARLVLGGTG